MKAIKAQYIGPTRLRSASVKAWDADGNTVRLNLDIALDVDSNYRAVVIALCHKMDWTGTIAAGEWRRGEQLYVFVDPETTFNV